MLGHNGYLSLARELSLTGDDTLATTFNLAFPLGGFLTNCCVADQFMARPIQLLARSPAVYDAPAPCALLELGVGGLPSSAPAPLRCRATASAASVDRSMRPSGLSCIASAAPSSE